MTTSPFKPSFIKGRKARPFLTFLWSAFAILAVFAYFFAPPYLARELSGVAEPSREQVKAARALIAAAIVLPFVLGMAWLTWQSRNAQSRTIERRPRAPVDDPSKRSTID